MGVVSSFDKICALNSIPRIHLILGVKINHGAGCPVSLIYLSTSKSLRDPVSKGRGGLERALTTQMQGPELRSHAWFEWEWPLWATVFEHFAPVGRTVWKGLEVWFCWKITEGGLWGFKTPHYSQLALFVPHGCVLKSKLSFTALSACLPASCHGPWYDDHWLTLWNCKPR